MPKHLETGTLGTGFHGDLYLINLVRQCLEKSTHFVETGTNYGTTLKYVADSFKQLHCYSCDIDIQRVRSASSNLKDRKNVSISHMDSRLFLEEYNNNTKDDEKVSTYWLDAHDISEQIPVNNELDVIIRSKSPSYVFIDDFQIPWSSKFGFEVDDNNIPLGFNKFESLKNLPESTAIYAPKYEERTSTHHPLRGWCMLQLFCDDELQHDDKRIHRFIAPKRPADPTTEINKFKLLSIIPKIKPVIIEAGAANGEDTFQLATLFPAGQVFSFEPTGSLFNLARQKTEKLSNVEISNTAIGGKSGISLFYESINSDGSPAGSSSIFRPTFHKIKHPQIEFRKKIIRIGLLSRFLQKRNISTVDLLWLDTQGNELDIISDLVSKKIVVNYIYVETQKKPLYDGVTTRDDLISSLKKQGFIVESLYDNVDYVALNVLLRNSEIDVKEK